MNKYETTTCFFIGWSYHEVITDNTFELTVKYLNVLHLCIHIQCFSYFMVVGGPPKRGGGRSLASGSPTLNPLLSH